MKKIIFVLIVTSLFFGCQKTWYVKEESSINEKERGVCYYLPEKSFDIKLNIKKYEFIPGPYSNYAKTLLSLDDISYTKNEFWKVESLEVSENVLPDDNHKYYIIPDKFMPDVSLTRSGLLAGLNYNEIVTDFDEYSEFYPQESVKDPSEIDFSNLQINRSKYEVIDTTYRTIKVDTVEKRIPVYKSRERIKTTEHKAKDAAEFIIRIRKSRFSLEALLEDQQISNVDVKTLINKLEELEEDYMELFTGKTFTKTIVKNYRVVPEANNRKQSIILDYLGNFSGKSVKDSINSSVLKLSINPIMNPWNNNVGENKKETEIALFSRQPMPARLNFLLNDKEIYSKTTYCPQMGWIRKIPATVADKNTVFIMDTETGAVKKIENQRD